MYQKFGHTVTILSANGEDADVFPIPGANGHMTREIRTEPFNHMVLSYNIPSPDVKIFAHVITTTGRRLEIPIAKREERGYWESLSGERMVQDTISLYEGEFGYNIQLFIAGKTEAVTVKSLAFTAWSRPKACADIRPLKYVATSIAPLRVPLKSQWNADVLAYPYQEEEGVAHLVCNPTAVAAAAEYVTGNPTSVSAIARTLFDQGATDYRNWSFAVNALAQAIDGNAYVAYKPGLKVLIEEWEAGRPTIISHAWEEGELTRAPIPRSDGHLIVVCGFENGASGTLRDGYMVVMDPAAQPGSGYCKYLLSEIVLTWKRRGIAYLIEPKK